MSDNWELAVSHARGEFVTVVGDDDGLLFHCLRDADEIIRALKVTLLQGKQTLYHWPGVEEFGLRGNAFLIPIPTPVRVIGCERVLGNAMHHLPNAMGLPSIYNSFVHRDVLERLKTAAGRLFNAAAPDWYSAFAVVSTLDRYAESGMPLRASAVSPKSNGMAHLTNPEAPIAAEFFRLNAATGLDWSPEVPAIPKSLSAVGADCIQRIRDHLHPGDRRLVLDVRRVVDAIVSDLQRGYHPVSAADWNKYRDELRRYVGRDPGGLEWFEAKYASLNSGTPPTWAPPTPWPFGLSSSQLTLDASQWGVTDVYGAAELFEKLFQRESQKISVGLERSAFARWSSATAELVRSLSPPTVVDIWRRFGKRANRGRQRGAISNARTRLST